MDTNDGRKHLHDVMKDFDVAMLVTHSGDSMHARPMAIACLDEGTVYDAANAYVTGVTPKSDEAQHATVHM